MLQLKPTYLECTVNIIPVLDNDNVHMKYVQADRFWQQNTILHMTGLKCSALHVYTAQNYRPAPWLLGPHWSVDDSLHIPPLNGHASVPTHWYFFRSCLLAMAHYKYNTDISVPSTTAQTCLQITFVAECPTKHMAGIWTIPKMYAVMYLRLLYGGTSPLHY